MQLKNPNYVKGVDLRTAIAREDKKHKIKNMIFFMITKSASCKIRYKENVNLCNAFNRKNFQWTLIL